MTRQCSHNLFTEARTFILLVLVFLVSFHDLSLGTVIRAHFEHHCLARLRALEQPARGPRGVAHQPVAVLKPGEAFKFKPPPFIKRPEEK